MTKVSIIIPAYNQARYLPEAIASALGQTHPDVEVVVIDDGSPDDTAGAAAPFLDRLNFRYVRQANEGLPGARNRGLRESSGDYLCFLDADDAYRPEKVARQAALLDADPELGWVYCDVAVVDESGRPSADAFSVGAAHRNLSGDLFDSLFRSGYFPPHTVMIRRSVLEAVGSFDRELGGYADYELWLRVAGAGHRAVFVPEPLAIYRIHADSMSKDAEHMRATRRAALERILRRLPGQSAEGIGRLQDLIHEMYLANRWLQEQAAAAPHVVPAAAAAPADDRYAALTLLWRTKLEAGKALAELKLDGPAARLMLEGVKAVEKSRHARVIFEALTEIPVALAPLDPGRARYLLGLAAKMAESLHRPQERDHALRLQARIGAPAAAPAPALAECPAP